MHNRFFFVPTNSPNLCPTILLLIQKTTNFFPLKTEKFKPTNEGKTTERRDQILIIFFLLPDLNRKSTNFKTLKSSPKLKLDRGFFCMMGSCQECLVTIDGKKKLSCQTKIKEQIRINI